MSDVQTTETTTVGAVKTVYSWEQAQRNRLYSATRGLIDLEVIDLGRFRLVPRTDLGRSLLAQWLSCEWKPSLRMRPGSMMTEDGGDSHLFGRTCDDMEVSVMLPAGRGLLAKGRDPYFTGMTVNRDEYEACRALVEQMRNATAKQPAKRSRKR